MNWIGLSERHEPWQLVMFRRSLKKQLKLEALLKILGDASNQECLLVTCGDNNGALNWYFREQGGQWTWGDVEAENLSEISDFLGNPVFAIPAGRFPFSSDQFDCAVAVDVLEHLQDDGAFLRELFRVLRCGGRAIVTVPNGDPNLWANRLKGWVGMSPGRYGHVRAGYTLGQLRKVMQEAGFQVVGESGYSRFFTEMMELLINFIYVFLLSKRRGTAVHGRIAPTKASEFQAHGVAFRFYSLLYPVMRLVSRLDFLRPERTNNAVIVSAVRPESSA